MDVWVPFFQTLLWILLIVGVLWKFHAQAVAVLEAIKTRIEKGSSIKAGPFELGQQDLRPQGRDQQEKLLNDKVKEVQQESSSTHTQLIANLNDSYLRNRVLFAEELAMRELQVEFDVVISRQVNIGRNFGMDGIFAKGSGGFGVEVKYVRKGLLREQLKQVVYRFQNFVQSKGWMRFTMILVVVYDGDDSQLQKQQEFLHSTLSEFQGSVLWRLYSLKQLAEKYGLSLPPPI
jgi:hypothetical protein